MTPEIHFTCKTNKIPHQNLHFYKIAMISPTLFKCLKLLLIAKSNIKLHSKLTKALQTNSIK